MKNGKVALFSIAKTRAMANEERKRLKGDNLQIWHFRRLNWCVCAF